MAIVVGDIHSNFEIAKFFLDHRPEEPHIALGDLVDSRRRISLDEEMACLQLMLDSTTRFLWGNHELAYLEQRPWKPYGNFSDMAFREPLERHRKRFSAALAVDGWLLTHAGVGPALAEVIPADIKEGGVVAVASWLNEEFAKELLVPNPLIIIGPKRYGYGPLFNASIWRGGVNSFGGIFWFDPDAEQSELAPGVGPQIFGHTPTCTPMGHSHILRNGKTIIGERWINLNTPDGALIYDTQRDELVIPGVAREM